MGCIVCLSGIGGGLEFVSVWLLVNDGFLDWLCVGVVSLYNVLIG